MNQGFPIPVLQHIEPFLDDASCSALARVNKTHMFLCYARAKRLFGWGKRKFPRYLVDKFIFPKDTFLQMQLSKQLLMNEGDPKMHSKSSVAQFVEICKANENNIDAILESAFTVAVPLNITYDFYKSKIAFLPPKRILEDVSKLSKLEVTTHRMWLALNILLENSVAKCSLAALLNRPSVYKRHVEHVGDRLFFTEAMSGIVDEFSNTDIIIDEAWRMEKEDLQEELRRICEGHDSGPFFFFEHPDLALEWRDQLPLKLCFRTLMDSPNFIDRCTKFKRLLRLRDEEIMKLFTEEDECSPIYYDFEDCVTSGFCSLEELTKFINFPITRQAAIDRCFQLLKYYWIEGKENKYNKMLEFLKHNRK